MKFTCSSDVVMRRLLIGGVLFAGVTSAFSQVSPTEVANPRAKADEQKYLPRLVSLQQVFVERSRTANVRDRVTREGDFSNFHGQSSAKYSNYSVVSEPRPGKNGSKSVEVYGQGGGSIPAVAKPVRPSKRKLNGKEVPDVVRVPTRRPAPVRSISGLTLRDFGQNF